MEASYMNMMKSFITLFLVSMFLLPVNSLADANLQGQLNKNSAKMADIYREKLNEVQDAKCLTNQEVAEDVKAYSDYLSEQNEAFLQSVETMIVPDLGGCSSTWPSAYKPESDSMQSTSITASNDELINMPEEGFSTDGARRRPNGWKAGLLGYWSLCTIQYYADLYECQQRCIGTCRDLGCYEQCANDAFHRYVECMAFRF